MNNIKYIYENKKEFLSFIENTFKEFTLTKNNNTKKDLFKYQKFIWSKISLSNGQKNALVSAGNKKSIESNEPPVRLLTQ